MKFSEFLWEEFIYGGHWLSIGASSIVLSIMIIYDMSVHWEFLFIVYLLLQCIYSYNHYKEFEEDLHSNSPRVKHLSKYRYRIPYIIGIYGVIFLGLLIYSGNKESIFFGGFLLLAGLFFTTDGKKITKKIIGFKTIYVAISWALLVPFTAIYCSYVLSMHLLLLFIFVFLRFIVSTTFFDIKDMKSDKKQGFLTLPLVIKNNKHWLFYLHMLNAISFLPIILGILLQIFPIYLIFLLVLFVYSLYYIQKAKKKDIDMLSLSYIIVDGEFYYWPFLLILGLIFIS